MASSSFGSRRMNSPENPPTVDCNVIGMAALESIAFVLVG
jgi:hypothetical protein